MDPLQALGAGFAVALQPVNLLYCFAGVFIGTLIGVLPGIGPVGAMSLLFPVTFQATPEAAIIMLAGIYYGAMYGGSTPSILLNIPGEAAAAVTRPRGLGLVRRGAPARHGPDGAAPAALEVRPQVRPRRVLLAHGAGAHHPHLSGPRLHAEGPPDGRLRDRPRARRARCHHRAAQAHVRPDGAGGRRRPGADPDGGLRDRGGPRHPDPGPPSHGEGLAREPLGGGARVARGLLSGDPPRRGRGDLLVPLLRAGEARVEAPRALRQGRHRRGGGTRGRQQRRGRRGLHPPHHARPPPAPGRGPAARGPDG